MSVALAPGVDLLAGGTGHAIKADRAVMPRRGISHKPGRYAAARHRATDHHPCRINVFTHAQEPLSFVAECLSHMG